VKLGWIERFSDKGRQVVEVLRFFAVASVEAWESHYGQRFAPAFRKSDAFEAKRGAVAAWLRKTEIEASKLVLPKYDAPTLRASLSELRQLTVEPRPDVFIPEAQRICGAAGVAFVFVPAPKGCPAYGATWWRLGTPIVALSGRRKSDDQFWFSLFHEIGHVLLHGRKDVLITGNDVDGADPTKEAEANAFAATKLIPDEAALARLKASATLSEATVQAFAERVGIAPGIVVGRLQHDGFVSQRRLNSLKVFYGRAS
jgi:HTH-type transcriptional regulator / antitoxin HigA